MQFSTYPCACLSCPEDPGGGGTYLLHLPPVRSFSSSIPFTALSPSSSPPPDSPTPAQYHHLLHCHLHSTSARFQAH